ncbi:NADH-ubiquinone oxidoreductase 14.8 kDa subunit [Lachnellula occidentalis]|uniref:NADH-ubiquinone oxidoreductase 14.8 kDa subunit n=1 Tax=Lachnellula occidentalis TaxID=215460 RepID=A0A8H8S1B5_9HELO|nr:NADH-ubiquinone oxidoreductase 14.8 kDa subunit [Lachnellula occidentalis]
MAWDSRGDDLNWANGWILQAPEIQTMYSLNMPVAQLRTKMREEFERHRYVNQMGVVDMLLFQSHAEFQETLNYWKQLPHILKYFRADEDPNARLPQNFMSGFLEASSSSFSQLQLS